MRLPGSAILNDATMVLVSGNNPTITERNMKLKCENNDLEKRKIKGDLEFMKIEGKNAKLSPFCKCDAIKSFYQYPLKLMLPKHASDNCCQWVYPVVYGGGLVGGDEISIDMKIGNECCVLLTSQSFPKVYKNGGKGACVQKLNFQVGNKSLLAVLSDPVVCFKDAIFQQEQIVNLSKESNLIYLDWFTAGRTARGEIWAFETLETSLSINIEGELILREALELSNTPEIKIKDTMGDFTVVGICVILGPYLENLCKSLISELNARKGCGEKLSSDLLFTASPLPKLIENQSPGCILRIAATTTASAYKELDRLLTPIRHILGGQPFENKY